MHAPALPRTYRELQLAVSHAPLELAVGLVRALEGVQYTVYENDGLVLFALGSVWTLEVESDGSIRCDGHLLETEKGLADTLDEATRQIPFEGWRAYGRAVFELAYLVHGVTPPERSGTLLKLSVPSAEIILESGQLRLRCFDANQLARLEETIRRLDAEVDLVPEGHPVQAHDSADYGDRYQDNVAEVVAEMHAHSYDKVILSRAVPVSQTIDLPLSFYAGRLNNTPTRSFLLRDGDFGAFGFSPETLLELDAAGRISTQPLAGTRALIGTPEEDRRLREDLLHDPKEIAEHAISVRLAIEEMQPLCEPESLGISEFMSVRPRGSVQHLASRVRGHLAEGVSAWDAFLSLFPAVTASGIPKPAALDSIRRHEPTARGLYSGCVFTLDQEGAMDAALVLRSMYRQGQKYWLQAGAGVVPLSTPERELEETREKLASVAGFLRAV